MNEQKALEEYGFEDYKVVNALNRMGVKEFKKKFKKQIDRVQEIKNMIKHIDNAMKKSIFSDIFKRYKSKVLWRGTETQLPFKGIGSQIKTKTYLSTSLKSKISSTFADKECCMYEIIPDENINVVDMKKYESANESEILIDRNVTLTLKGEYTEEFESQDDDQPKKKLKVYKITVSKAEPKAEPKAAKVYKDTPLNRKLNRVGKPYGYVAPN